MVNRRSSTQCSAEHSTSVDATTWYEVTLFFEAGPHCGKSGRQSLTAEVPGLPE